jgi:hypothetical protein
LRDGGAVGTGTAASNRNRESTSIMAASNPTRKATYRIELDEEGEELTRKATAALERIERGETWEQWLDVGRAIDHARTLLMRQLHLNRPTGPAYSDAIGAYLIEHGLDRIDKGARSRLQKCIDNLAAIERWRAELTRSRRAELNHPNAVWRNWPGSRSMTDKEPGAAPAGMKAEVARLQEELDAAQAEIARLKRTSDNVGEGRDWTWADKAELTARIWYRDQMTKIVQISSEVLRLHKSTTQKPRPRSRQTEPAKSS